MRVLVVDDDESNRFVVAEVLADDGYEVVPAADGVGALALLADWRPDLIVLDLLMPEMDGWAFLAAYQQLPPPHCPVVLMTAASVARPGTVWHRPLPPAADVLAKPFDLDTLTALVGRYRPWPPTAPVPAQDAGDDTQSLRRRQQAEVAQVRTEVRAHLAQARHLLEVSATRPLTPDETQAASALWQDWQALFLRLRQMQAEFAQLRGDQRPASKEERWLWKVVNRRQPRDHPPRPPASRPPGWLGRVRSSAHLRVVPPAPGAYSKVQANPGAVSAGSGVMDRPDAVRGDLRAEWDALAAEHHRLLAELERLRGQHPLDLAAHRAYSERLALHQRKLTAWQARLMRQA